MANVEKIRFVQNEPLIEVLETLLEEKFSFSKTDRVLNIIEIGCGPGDFSLIFKDKFKDKVQITAIDPSDDIEQAKAKSNGNDVDFQRSDIFKFTSNVKFDLVLFTKSLHHCIPIDQAVKNAYNLLSDDGIFFAEEVYVDKMNLNDITWFFNRVDLLQSAGCMKDFEELAKHTSFDKSKLAKLLDSNLPVSERWFRPHIQGDSHGHSHKHEHGEEHKHEHGEEHKHEHGEEHKHEHGHGHNHGHNQEHSHNHQHDSSHGHNHENHDGNFTIVGSSAVVQAIIAKFGEEKLTFTDVPYFYQFLVFLGLKDTETNKAVIKQFYKQEKQANENKVISPLGLFIVGHK